MFNTLETHEKPKCPRCTMGDDYSREVEVGNSPKDWAYASENQSNAHPNKMAHHRSRFPTPPKLKKYKIGKLFWV